MHTAHVKASLQLTLIFLYTYFQETRKPQDGTRAYLELDKIERSEASDVEPETARADVVPGKFLAVVDDQALFQIPRPELNQDVAEEHNITDHITGHPVQVEVVLELRKCLHGTQDFPRLNYTFGAERHM